MSVIISYSSMDNIRIIRSKNRRTVSLQILPDASIVVSVPDSFPDTKIKKLIQEREEWINKHLQIIHARKSILNASLEKEYFYLGKGYQLEMRTNQKEVVELTDKFYVASKNKNLIKNFMESWYKVQARKIIGERVKLYATHAKLDYVSVGITSAETRWGSCSFDKKLNFNWKLIMAPLPVIDYVIAHELAHTVELNHSNYFWKTVGKIYPIYREHRTWLKRHGNMLNLTVE